MRDIVTIDNFGMTALINKDGTFGIIGNRSLQGRFELIVAKTLIGKLMPIDTVDQESKRR